MAPVSLTKPKALSVFRGLQGSTSLLQLSEEIGQKVGLAFENPKKGALEANLLSIKKPT